jgi:hypothetical protein
MVAEAFMGSIPEGMVVCHNDGDPSNNHLDNLRVDTQAANLADRWEHGTHRGGPLAEHAADIRRRVAAGESQRSLAREFEVSKTAIWLIVHGKNYKHATPR